MKLPAQAAMVGARLPMSRLHPAVAQWAQDSRKRGPWCVALSGGADSVALLLATWALWPARREALVVLHFNHRLRGAESDRDEAFCRALCRRLGVALRVGRWRRPPSDPSEAVARLARHDFFRHEMIATGSKVLWLAHHRDDVAETMLMRLARGSGTAGLAAPRPIQAFPGGVVYLRPFLPVARAELTQALRESGLAWRSDASNQSDRFLRNRIRQTVIPAWTEAAHRDAVAGAALSRDLLEDDDRALEQWADESAALSRGVLDAAVCAKVPIAVARRLLRRWLVRCGVKTDLSRQGFEVLLAALRAGRATRFSLGTGYACLRRGELRFKRR